MLPVMLVVEGLLLLMLIMKELLLLIMGGLEVLNIHADHSANDDCE